jgi:hypothetical protein
MTIDDSRRPTAAVLAIQAMGTPPVEDDALLSEADARTILPLGKTLFRELAARGELTSCKVDRRRLYSRRSLQHYISTRLAASDAT